MKKQEHKVEVKVWGIEVESTQTYGDGKEAGWYKYEWAYRIDGGKWKYGQHGSSWSNQTAKHFRRVLNRSAFRSVLTRIGES